MNRIYKFRAWDEANKKMFTDVQFIKSGDDNSDWILFTSNEQQYKVEGDKIVFDNPYFRQQIKIMQFTGLLDKNGKETYEGDRIKIILVDKDKRATKNETSEHIGVIVYNDLLAQFETQMDNGRQFNFNYFLTMWGSDFSFEIIGNIYESKEQK